MTSTLTSGQCTSSSLTSGAASISCSKLSSMRSVASLSSSFMFSNSVLFPAPRTPRAWLMVEGTALASRIAERSTKKTPPGNAEAAFVAICRLRRVFPIPPGPIRVTRRTSSRNRSSVTASCSYLRPINGVNCAGRFVRGCRLFKCVPCCFEDGALMRLHNLVEQAIVPGNHAAHDFRVAFPTCGAPFDSPYEPHGVSPVLHV